MCTDGGRRLRNVIDKIFTLRLNKRWKCVGIYWGASWKISVWVNNLSLKASWPIKSPRAFALALKIEWVKRLENWAPRQSRCLTSNGQESREWLLEPKFYSIHIVFIWKCFFFFFSNLQNKCGIWFFVVSMNWCWHFIASTDFSHAILIDSTHTKNFCSVYYSLYSLKYN